MLFASPVCAVDDGGQSLHCMVNKTDVLIIQTASPEMLEALAKLRTKCSIGFVCFHMTDSLCSDDRSRSISLSIPLRKRD